MLRTDARAPADRDKYPDDPRNWMGFNVEHSDEELEAASLRWWRSDPRRVVDNELFAVTVATFPVAVYRILGTAGSIASESRTSLEPSISWASAAGSRPSAMSSATSSTRTARCIETAQLTLPANSNLEVARSRHVWGPCSKTSSRRATGPEWLRLGVA
ncbi:hypothetical protein [Nocardioides marmoriginsengisoli]|uniref:hypothetical protein n=1 Tax=Nocardioides marmoriginsengisoli TaxID=661483 RepID=UPI0011CDBD01|nr:hypothetical protein [Nocardioides marmoriginsengisoli]